jgi:regulatory protein
MAQARTLRRGGDRGLGRRLSGKRQGPAKATPASLRRAAESYVARFASSAEQLRRVLMRRVERSARAHDTDREAGAAEVGKIIDRYRELGLIDDAAFARSRAAGLFGRGESPSAIRRRLMLQGVGETDIDDALAHLLDDSEDAHTIDDLADEAAIRFARRSRIGPFRRQPADADGKRRELARLARRGFGLEIAKRIVYAETEEDLET